MAATKDERKDEGIKAYSFAVEVIEKPNVPKQFIVRVQTQMGVSVACFGTIKEFNQFVASL